MSLCFHLAPQYWYLGTSKKKGDLPRDIPLQAHTEDLDLTNVRKDFLKSIIWKKANIHVEDLRRNLLRT